MLSCPCLLIIVGNSLAVITVAVVQRGDGFRHSYTESREMGVHLGRRRGHGALSSLFFPPSRISFSLCSGLQSWAVRAGQVADANWGEGLLE